jgi:hypothetical protein
MTAIQATHEGLQELLANNKAWAAGIKAKDPEFFNIS